MQKVHHSWYFDGRHYPVATPWRSYTHWSPYKGTSAALFDSLLSSFPIVVADPFWSCDCLCYCLFYLTNWPSLVAYCLHFDQVKSGMPIVDQSTWLHRHLKFCALVLSGSFRRVFRVLLSKLSAKLSLICAIYILTWPNQGCLWWQGHIAASPFEIFCN
jgi:hypothetical protein